LPLAVILFVLGMHTLPFIADILVFVAVALGTPIIATVAFEFGIVLYDIAAKKLGGACLEIEGGEIKRIDLSSYLRIALPLSLIYLIFCFAAMIYLSNSRGLTGDYLALYPIIVGAAISSLNGIVDPVVYDLIVDRIGGAKISLSAGKLKSVGVWPGAKIGAILVAFNYVFYMFITTAALVLMIGPPGLQQSYPSLVNPYVSFIGYAIVYLVGGFIASAIVLYLYNKLSGKVGHIELNVRNVRRA
jgi:hypothetical protein